MSVQQLAQTALYAALLIVSQLMLSGIFGIELVTPLFVVFCYARGRMGYFLALLFASLRCLIFGFTPAVWLLYMLYYPLFCAGILAYKHHPLPFRTALFLTGPVLCGLLAFWSGFPILIIVLAALFAEGVLLVWEHFFTGSRLAFGLGLLAFAFTILFSLLDDLITPLLYRYSIPLWLAYFQASLPVAMIQSILAWISTTCLALPLLHLLQRFSPGTNKEEL